jgi:peroxiredoxin family protein
MERHLIEAHDLLWDMKIGLVGFQGKNLKLTVEKKRRGRPKKKPIEYPYHPSINQWMIMKRPMMNALKQKRKAFMVWFIEQNGYTNLKLDKCEMSFIVYFKTTSCTVDPGCIR